MPTIEELTSEVETLRRVNADLLTKKQKSKEKIATLEASVIDLQTQLEAAKQQVKTVGVERPVSRLLASISAVPNVLAEQLAKQYRFESADTGELLLMNIDGTPAIKDDSGEAGPVDEQSLRDLLCPKDSTDASAKVYSHLLIGSKATGGGASGSGRSKNETATHGEELRPAAKAASPYGLR